MGIIGCCHNDTSSVFYYFQQCSELSGVAGIFGDSISIARNLNTYVTCSVFCKTKGTISF